MPIIEHAEIWPPDHMISPVKHRLPCAKLARLCGRGTEAVPRAIWSGGRHQPVVTRGLSPAAKCRLRIWREAALG